MLSFHHPTHGLANGIVVDVNVVAVVALLSSTTVRYILLPRLDSTRLLDSTSRTLAQPIVIRKV